MDNTFDNLEQVSAFVTLPLDCGDTNNLMEISGITSDPLEIIYILDPAGGLNLPQVFQQQINATEIGNEPPSESPQIEQPEYYLRLNQQVEKESSGSPQILQPLQCNKCNQVFDKRPLYKKHMTLHHDSNKILKCDKCSQQFTNSYNLKIHGSVHVEGKPTCPCCHLKFQRFASLKAHLVQHQTEEQFKCEECALEFNLEEDLIKHAQSHSNSSLKHDLTCPHCQLEFEDIKSYKEHISHHTKIKKMVFVGKRTRQKGKEAKDFKHKCIVCDKMFSKQSLLTRHLRTHSGERPFVCFVCNKGFTQKTTLQVHLTRHTGEKPYQCTLCLSRFTQKGNLRAHVEKVHTAPKAGVKTLKCSQCPSVFKRVASLNTHITRAHAFAGLDASQGLSAGDLESMGSYVKLTDSYPDGTLRKYQLKQILVNNQRWYVCSFCSRLFKKPSDLIRHTRVHTGEKPYTCTECKVSFTLKTSLVTHLRTHVKSHICVICRKTFGTSAILDKHLIKHARSQVPEYKCVICDKWFSSIYQAKVHVTRLHSSSLGKDLNKALKTNNLMDRPLVMSPHGLVPLVSSTEESADRPYGCPMCEVKFTKLDNLKRHNLLHMVQRQYKCEDCPKTFCSLYSLREHQFVHTGIRNHICKTCGQSYTTAALLRRHMISHNSDKPYYCPYCRRNFKTLFVCKKHIATFHKGKKLQEQSLGQAKKDFDPLLTLNQDDNILRQSSGFQEQDNNTQAFQVAPNSVQIVADSGKDDGQKQTILVSCDNLQLTDNLYQQSRDSLLFNPLNINDLPDGSVFSIDPLNGDFFPQSAEICNNDIFANNPTTAQEQDTNKIENDPSATNEQLSFYHNTDINLLFNLDPVFDGGNLNLTDIKLSVPAPKAEPFVPAEIKAVEDVEEPKAKKRGLKCELCKRFFTNENNYIRHMKTHKRVIKNRKDPVSAQHECTFCLKNFKKNCDLVRHLRTHTGEKPFSCESCDKSFSLKSTLASHLKTHDPFSPRHPCTVCNTTFASKSSLALHMNQHTGARPHKCKFCPLTFKAAGHRKNHELLQHLTGDETTETRKEKKADQSEVPPPSLQTLENINFVLSPNGQDLESSNILVVHEQLQLPGDQLNILSETTPALGDSIQLEPMVLPQLPSSFMLPEQFQQSMIQVNVGTFLNIKTASPSEQPSDDVASDNNNAKVIDGDQKIRVTCDICQKSYASKDVLRKHKKIHGVNKEFPCSKCDKGFDSEVALRRHDNLHLGIRPHACSLCGNTFAKRQSLKTHLKRIHQGRIS